VQTCALCFVLCMCLLPDRRKTTTSTRNEKTLRNSSYSLIVYSAWIQGVSSGQKPTELVAQLATPWMQFGN